MNDLNFAGLIAARQAATQGQAAQSQDRTMDSRAAASAFDAAMARASRNEASRGSDGGAAETRRTREPERADSKSQGADRSRETARAPHDAPRHGTAERTRAQGDVESTAERSKPGSKTDASRGDTKDAAAAASDANALPAIPVLPDAPVASMPEAATPAFAAGVPAGTGTAEPAATESDFESTVIRSDDPLADALATPRGMARAMPPHDAAAVSAKGPPGAPVAGDDAPVHATPFERLVEASQRESAVPREFNAARTTDAAAPMRVDGTMPSASMFAPAAPATYSVAHGTVSTPVGHPAFAEEFAQRVVLFSSQKVHNAQIALSPAELGPISIAIEMRGQEAHLNFSAAHATTRAAIEDALPKLREMFANHGLQLANANVGDQPAHRDYGRAQRGEPSQVASVGAAASSGGSAAAATIDTQAMRTNWLRSDRLIDIVV